MPNILPSGKIEPIDIPPENLAEGLIRGAEALLIGTPTGDPRADKLAALLALLPTVAIAAPKILIRSLRVVPTAQRARGVFEVVPGTPFRAGQFVIKENPFGTHFVRKDGSIVDLTEYPELVRWLRSSTRQHELAHVKTASEVPTLFRAYDAAANLGRRPGVRPAPDAAQRQLVVELLGAMAQAQHDKSSHAIARNLAEYAAHNPELSTEIGRAFKFSPKIEYQIGGAGGRWIPDLEFAEELAQVIKKVAEDPILGLRTFLARSRVPRKVQEEIWKLPWVREVQQMVQQGRWYSTSHPSPIRRMLDLLQANKRGTP